MAKKEEEDSTRQPNDDFFDRLEEECTPEEHCEVIHNDRDIDEVIAERDTKNEDK